MRIDQLYSLLNENWDHWFQKPFPKKLHVLKTAGNSLSKGRVTLLIFEDDCSVPILVVKIPRNENQYLSINAEYEILKQLTNLSIPGIPLPLLFSEGIYIETPVKGKLMGNIRSPWINNLSSPTRKLIQMHFREALGWLAILGTRTLVKSETFDEVFYNRMIEQAILGEFESDQISPDLRYMVKKLVLQVMKSIEHERLPLVCEHGDFWAGNIFLGDQEISVIDWAGASLHKVPLYDAPFFVISYSLGFSAKNNDPLILYKELLKGDGFFAHLAIDKLNEYFHLIGIPNINPWYSIGIGVLRRAIIERSQNTGISIYQTMCDLWAKQFLDEL